MEESRNSRPPFSSASRATFARRLLAWYDEHARDLPWRANRDPYRVWLSEIMLQQTQVATVDGYFRRFVTEFPTVERLAIAPLDRVLRLWEGLGYYRRARQLHAAARRVVEEHGCQFPRDVETLRTLPGVGRYTAGAVASIAFDTRAPILEANTARLLARLIALREVTSATASQKKLWETAEAILPARDVGRFNQALMELGSQICAPRAPKCGDCPVSGHCQAKAQGLVDHIPAVRAPKAFDDRREAVVVVHRGGRVLVARRGERGRWAGMWDFPRFDLTDVAAADTHRALADRMRAATGLDVRLGERLATLKHGVTRFRITLECHAATVVSGKLKPSAQGKWLSHAALAELPLNTTGRKVALMAAGKANERQ